MKIHPLLPGIGGIAVLAISACGAATAASAPAATAAPSSPAATATPTSAPTATAQAASTTLSVGHTSLGTFLVDGKGLTLYLFQADKGSTPTCYGACASNWPPFLTNGAVTVSGGASMAMVGTATRTGGAKQVTYNGHPLYYFVADSKPGDTNGQGVNAFGALWYVVAPSGATLTSSNGGGGGY
jgi:predicted lipoprotein with Yx(FWY)xxD motif